MPKRKPAKKASNGRVEGEGSYSASRDYDRNIRRALADKRSIARGAERARQAVEGVERTELRAAEERARGGPRKTAPAQRGARAAKRVQAR